MAASRTSTVARAPRPRRSAPGALALGAFAAAMSRGDSARAVRALARVRAAGLPRRAAEETGLMLMLYAGYPGALEALRVLNGAWPGRPRASREGGVTAWTRRGRALCRRVYGPAFGRLVPAVEALHPDLARWMIEQGYGRVLSRPGLAAVDRELVTVSALAALGWERQLVSHVLGARRLGAARADIERALRAGLAGAGARSWAAATRAWEALAGPASDRALADRPNRLRPKGIQARPRPRRAAPREA